MDFEYSYTKFILDQLKLCSEKDKIRISNKVELIKINPFKYPTLKGYNQVRKIKISFGNKYSRLIYVLFWPDKKSITFLGIFPRDNDYSDVSKLLKDLGLKK